MPHAPQLVLWTDSRLAEYQKERWAGDPHVEVHHADGASWDPRGCLRRPLSPLTSSLFRGGAILQNFCPGPVLWNVPW
ncbi:MAG: hypothetical protein ACLSUW_09970 [Akkermansia sp.]